MANNEEVDWDYLYESERDDKDIEESEKRDSTARKSEIQVCVHCGGEFDEWDLDRCDGEWICRECEDKLK